MKLGIICGLFLAAFVALSLAEKARFDNYKVYSLNITNEAQLDVLRSLEEQNRYTFWSLAERTTNIVVAPHQASEFDDLVSALNIEHTMTVDNIQRLIDEENPMHNPRAPIVDWQRYNTFEEINAWLSDKVAQYPQLLTNFNIGQTTEGRPMRVIRLSARAGNRAIFVEANIHAREWITSATATWFLNELLTTTNAEVREMANTIDWYFLVVANPDGFAFTHTNNRMWRKNRSFGGSNICVGTDPNRNFDFHWMRGGASNQPCSDTFGGPHAFSEPETRAIRDFYASIASRTRIFMSLHAFGQYLLLPYGHVTSPSHNHGNLMSVGTATVNAIRQRYNTDYILGSVANVMYIATGSSPDWAFGIHNTPLTYTFELRDHRNGEFGFILPANQIIPNCLEFLDGVRAMIRQSRQLNQL